MNRVVHFEIQADDSKRAISFYSKVFGWEMTKMKDIDYWLIMTAAKDSKEPGINGGLQPRSAKTPPKQHGTNAYVCTVDVEDFDATAKKIFDNGGIEAMPKFDMMGMAWQGYFLDTEGNTFGIHQVKNREG